MATETAFQSWAIVEVMGHSRYAGHVTEQSIGGSSFVRVDVPETPRQPAFTKLLGASSIFAITPCDEQLARAQAETYCSPPLTGLTLPEQMQREIEAGRRVLAATQAPDSAPSAIDGLPHFDPCSRCRRDPCDCELSADGDEDVDDEDDDGGPW